MLKHIIILIVVILLCLVSLP